MDSKVFIELNLLPAQFSRNKKKRLIKGEQILIGLLVFVLATTVVVLLQTDKQQEIERIDAQIRSVQVQIDANIGVKQTIDQLQQKKNSIQQRIDALRNISIQRDKWVLIMELLERALPSETWFDKIIQDRADLHIIRITGKTYDFDSIARYMRNLEQDPKVGSVNLTNIQQAAFGEENVYSFDFFLELKRQE